MCVCLRVRLSLFVSMLEFALVLVLAFALDCVGTQADVCLFVCVCVRV